MPKVAGFNHQTGEYQGQSYDNYFFVVYDKNEKDSRKWSFVKVKNRLLIDHNISPKDLINKDIEFLYDRYGGAKRIIIDGIK